MVSLKSQIQLPRTRSRFRFPIEIPTLFAIAFVILLLVAIFWPSILTGYDPIESDSSKVLLPPSLEHIFGTDQSGRDVFARVVYGTQASVSVAFRAVIIALLLGTVLGVISSFSPKIIDSIISRITEILLAFPEFLLALVVVAIVGRGADAIALGITFAAVPVYIRMARVQSQLVRNSDYLQAAKILGLSPIRSVWIHVLPNVVMRISILAILGFASAISATAGLSFLGLGLLPPAPEWGVIMSEGRNRIQDAWWITLLTGLVLAITVIAVTVLARKLRALAGEK